MDLQRASMPMGKKPALVLVDMINGFTDASCSLGSDCPDVIAANAEILAQFRALELPIFFTTVVYKNADQAPVFRGRIDALNQLTPDSHWVEVNPALSMQDGEVLVEKQWASAFHKTDLDDQLRGQGVDSLIITGLTTSGCVRASVVDGLQYDYPIFVPREAVGDRNTDAHAANLFDMHAKYADVLSLSDVMAAIAASQSKNHE